MECTKLVRTVPSSLFCCLYRLFTIGTAGMRSSSSKANWEHLSYGRSFLRRAEPAMRIQGLNSASEFCRNAAGLALHSLLWLSLHPLRMRSREALGLPRGVLRG